MCRLPHPVASQTAVLTHTSLVFVSLLVITIIGGFIKVLYNRQKYVPQHSQGCNRLQ